MSKPITDSDIETAASGEAVSLRRRVLLYATPLISGGALIAVIYFLRLDLFEEWRKSLVDLVMVAIAIVFFVSLYMVIDSILREHGQA